MPELVTCPGCYSMNKPTATRCRVCGRALVESRRSKQRSEPIVLERVMSGEIFTAVLDHVPESASSIVRDLDKERAELKREAEDLEEYRNSLKDCEARLKAKAARAGKRVEPLSRPKRRRWNRDQAAEEAEEVVESAMAAFREKKFSEAVDHLKEAIHGFDEDPRSWILLGEAQLQLGQPYDAAAAFLRVLALDPKNERGWLGFAKALRLTEDLPGALDGVNRALAIEPRLAEGWYERGVILEGLENLAEALRSFAKVLELRPGHLSAKARRTEVEGKLLAQARLSGSYAPETAITTGVGAPTPATEEAPEAAISAKLGAPPVVIEDLDEILGLKDLPTPEKPSPKEETEPAKPMEAPAAVRPAQPVPRPARIKTYVDGLDGVMEGGIPWGHVVLVQGAPGTMKSSLGFWILLNNAVQEGRHCLYVTLEERADSLLRQMASLGFNLNVTKGSLVFVDPKTAKQLLGEHADWIPSLERALAAIKRERGLDLVVIDSLEALEVLAKFKDRRREMYRLFEWLRDMDVTSIVITERPDWVIGKHVLQGRWDEDFLADGLVQLRLHPVSDLEVQRRLRVVKMRGTKHEPGYLALVIDESRFKVMRAMSL